MPIYEYQCNNCHEAFEKLILAGPAEAISCPRCGSRSASRLVSRFALGRTEETPTTGSCCAGGACSCRSG